MSYVSESLKSLNKNERCEQITEAAHQKWANKQIAHLLIFFAKNERFAQKTDEQIPSPDF